MTEFETVIGLEVHVELSTKTKIFCGCPTAFGAAPNTQICPVCTGMPGSLPVLNKKVVEYAVAVGLAAHCEITRLSKFDRKNYFYPDNPQNYQISQLYLPICRNGFLEIEDDQGENKKIGIHEIHMEEDAGKLIHGEDGLTYIDYNRSGVPLIEIVSEPDMRSAQEVIRYLEKLRLMIQYLEVSDCKLNEGSMRADINLSVRKRGDSRLGTRTEMKNLNSFKAISRAVEQETNRQIRLIKEGKEVLLETRRWDDEKNTSVSMRSKEDARDYRYFPEPDLMPVRIDEEWLERQRKALPEFKEEKEKRYRIEYGIPAYDADQITNSKHLADLFEKTVSLGAPPKKVSNFLMGETMRLMKEHHLEADQLRFSPEYLASLIAMIEQKKINGSVAKEVFEHLFLDNVDPAIYVRQHGLEQNMDPDDLKKTVQQVIEQNSQSVSDYQSGKKKAFGFLMGQAMKQAGGKADPGILRELLTELLH